MISVSHGLHNFSLLAVCVRMLLATICGGVIGIEREYKRRPAGFRTHILICLGASMTTLTSQYLFLEMHYYIDPTRLGAQVVAGIGFIGAGTIIVTRRQRVKGLTTAAGLWTSAIVGLALGSGFYEGGIFVTVLILLAELFFSKMEYYILRNAPDANLYLEYSDKPCLDSVLKLLREQNVKVLSLEITRAERTEIHHACAIFSLQLRRKTQLERLMLMINSLHGIIVVEEL